MAKAPREVPTELEALVYIFHRYTNLPEILDFIFDEDVHEQPADRQFLSFLDRFGGMTLIIPRREQVAEAVRDLHIYRALAANPSRQNRERLAAVYRLNSDAVRDAYNKMKRIVEGQSESFREYVRHGPTPGLNVKDDKEGPGTLQTRAPSNKRKRGVKS